MTTPSPHGWPQSLQAVSCASADICTAVGMTSVRGTGKVKPLALHWNGSKWVDQPVPAVPGGAYFAELNLLSCPTSNTCVALGSQQKAADKLSRPLGEVWNGRRWRQIKMTAQMPESLSCTSATSCLVVG